MSDEVFRQGSNGVGEVGNGRKDFDGLIVILAPSKSLAAADGSGRARSHSREVCSSLANRLGPSTGRASGVGSGWFGRLHLGS